MDFLQRLILVILRRVAAKAPNSFREHVINIAADGAIEHLIESRNRSGFVTVEAGPFAGVRLLTRAPTGGHLARILGVYETQLIPALQSAAARQPATVVNIGCGDAFYLAAAALLLPDAHLIGFEASDTTRADAQAVLAANGLTDRAELHGFCDPPLLRRLLPAGSLLLVDCEGGEVELLDPVSTPNLRTASIVVELHEGIRPGVTEQLRQRFRDSHRVEIIDQAQPFPFASKDIAAYPESLVRAIVSERRGELMQWGYFEPRSTAA